MHVSIQVVLVFFLEAIYVTIMTCRWIILMRGRRWLASTISIFEQLLYVAALGLVVVGLHNPLRAVAYAVGYGVGSVVGSWVEERIAVGYVVIHVVTAIDSSLTSVLRSAKIAVTSWVGDGLDGKRQVLMVASRRKSIQYTMDLIQQTDPRAFVTRADLQSLHGGYLNPLKAFRP